MELNEAIKNRKSIRHFHPKKKPNWRKIIECIDSVRYAPMAGNIFPLRFIIVDDSEKIKKIAAASQQDFISEAKYVVVVCTDNKMVLNSYEKRADKFCRQEAGAAIQNFLLNLTEAGLETCWIGYFVDNLIKETLKIPKKINIEALFPIGYKPEELGKSRKPKRKTDLGNIIYFNKYKNKRKKKIKKINS